MPDELPDDPVSLKQMLLEAFSLQEEVAHSYQTHIVDLKEQIKSLRNRLFERKSEHTVEPNTPQLALQRARKRADTSHRRYRRRSRCTDHPPWQTQTVVG